MRERGGEDTLDRFKKSALVYLGEVTRAAHRLTRDRALAEDLAQDTYLQAWKSFHHFQEGTNCRAWLYKILYHVFSRHRRKTWRESRQVPLERAPDGALAFDPPTPDVFTRAQLLAAFDRLPEPYRIAVLLADVEGLTYREIADVLEIPIGTVMSRLSRARKHLRRELVSQAEAHGLDVRAERSAGS